MEKIGLFTALILYLIAFVLLITQSRWRSWVIVISLSVFTHIGALVVRSLSANHPPFTNLYETLLLLSLLIALRLVFWQKQIESRYRWLVLLTGIICLGAALLLPAHFSVSKPLMPALNSFWMYIHVPAYFLGYMSLTLAFLFALIYLGTGKNESAPEIASLLRKLHNEVKIAFLFLNIGLVTGAIWAYLSWGNYWSWDPKEVWALINVLVLGIYFHLLKPRGTKKVWIVLLAFLCMLFTYFGVSFILSGLHSYA